MKEIGTRSALLNKPGCKTLKSYAHYWRSGSLRRLKVGIFKIVRVVSGRRRQCLGNINFEPCRFRARHGTSVTNCRHYRPCGISKSTHALVRLSQLSSVWRFVRLIISRASGPTLCIFEVFFADVRSLPTSPPRQREDQNRNDRDRDVEALHPVDQSVPLAAEKVAGQ